MDALFPALLGAMIGWAVMRRAATKQLRINEAVLQRDLTLLSRLPEDSPHRAEIRRRVDRMLDIDAGRPDSASVRRTIVSYAIGGVLASAACAYVVTDLLRTADERSDLIIGGFVIGMTGSVAGLALVAVLQLARLLSPRSGSTDRGERAS